MENEAFCGGVFVCNPLWWLILVLSKISQNTPRGVFYCSCAVGHNILCPYHLRTKLRHVCQRSRLRYRYGG